MKLASFAYQGRNRIGAQKREGELVELAVAAAAMGPDWKGGPVPETMLGVIEAGAHFSGALRVMAARLGDLDVASIPEAAVTWLPPVTRPGKIIGIAVNNSGSDSRKISAPNHPMFFLKPSTCLIGHKQHLEVRPYYGGLHPEPELVVVIGRRTRDVDAAAAMEAVYGYSIMNDITGNAMRAEDQLHYWALYATEADPTKLERREQHLSYTARYKGADGFGPMGPWLVTRDEIADPGVLDVTCTVGGEVIAEDSTRYLTYGVAEIISYVSQYQTLEPGDVISMGTAFRPQPGSTRSLHTADFQRVDGPCEVTITGLGTLSNPIRRTTHKIGAWRLPK